MAKAKEVSAKAVKKVEKVKEVAKKPASKKNCPCPVMSAMTLKLANAMKRKKITLKALAKSTKIDEERLSVIFEYKFMNVDLDEVIKIHKALGYGEIRIKL